MQRLLAIGLSLGLLPGFAACGSGSKPNAAAPPAALAEASHGLRIEHPIAVPTGYEVTLALDPARTDFDGEAEIALDIRERARDFYLNGYGLEVASASLEAQGERQDLVVEAEGEDWLHFVAERPFDPGPATLQVRYRGAIDSKSSFGVFRQEADDSWYLFTQFEARGARRAVPSYDQPDLKVPWTLTLEVPEGLVALANTPEVSREELGNGKMRVRFAESKPLPSYLWAFAVGPFDMVDIGKTRSDVPVRVAAPKGRGSETSWVQESTLRLIQIAEDYLGMPYPYAKLDLVSIPATGSFGAMENPGLITYSERLLLSKDNDLDFKKAYASVGAHELAHQWFGNLVTNAWWDDLWLNESFATWGSAKILDSFEPAWRSDLSAIGRRSRAMGADRLASARVIHQPIVEEGDIGAAFDGITYAKGAAVLAMFESWLGEDLFRRGLQHYLKSHRWQAVTAKDFLQSMDEGTGRAVSEAFASFIDKPGTPLLRFALECDQKPASVHIQQQRYRPLGSEVDTSERYVVPVCVRYPGPSGDAVRQCTLVDDQEVSSMPLTEAEGCPAWLVPNAGGTGYYRSQLEAGLQDALFARAPLTAAEELVLSLDLEALVYAGAAPMESLLARVPEMAASEDDGVVAIAAGIADLDGLVSPEDRPRYQRWLTKNFGKRAEALGWKARAKELPERKSLRETLLSLMIFEGRHEGLRRQGQKLAAQWLADPKSVDADVAGLALQVGAHWGDEALVNDYIAAIKATSDRSRRRLLLQGLGAVSEPALIQRALEVMLDPEIDVRESQRTLSSLAADRDHGSLAFDFVLENIDALKARYGEEMGTRLGRVASAQCDPEQKEAVEAFLKNTIAAMDGGKRAAAQGIERFRLCLAAREKLRLPVRL